MTKQFQALLALGITAALACAGRAGGGGDDTGSGNAGQEEGDGNGAGGAAGDPATDGMGGDSGHGAAGQAGAAGVAGSDPGAGRGGRAGETASAGGNGGNSGLPGSQSGGGNAGSSGNGSGGAPAMTTGNPVTDPPPQFTVVALSATNIPTFKKYNVDTTADLGDIDGLLWLPGTESMLVYAGGKMVRFNPTTQAITPFNTPAPGHPAFDEKGNLITAGGGKLSRIKMTGELIETLPSGFAGKPSAPSDVIVRKDGNIYFVDGTAKAGRVLRIAPDKTVSLVTSTISTPQGIVLGVDHGVLMVSSYDNKDITRFVLSADGVPGATTTWAQNFLDPDSVCIDHAGYVYLGTHSGMNEFSPTGDNLGRTAHAAPPSGSTIYFGSAQACTFGGPEGKTLYVGSWVRDGGTISMYAIEFPNPGLP